MTDILPNGKARPITHSELLELKLLRAEVLILREENSLFRERLNPMSRSSTIENASGLKFPYDWNLTVNEANMLEAICKKSSLPNSCASKEYLHGVLYALAHDNKIPEMKIIDVFKCKLVKKLTAGGFPNDIISTRWGVGYFIPQKYLHLFKDYITSAVVG